jgi:acyl-CoA thioester hydrolase
MAFAVFVVVRGWAMQLPPLEERLAVTTVPLRVRFCETDLMGIVHHAAYLTYFEAARVEWLRRRGITYSSWMARDIHLPVVDASLRYRGPAKFDDVLSVECRLVELRWASLRYSYVVRRGEGVLADGSTRLACVDGSHSLKRLPADMLAVLASGERQDS